jgi:hypothetical protein
MRKRLERDLKERARRGVAWRGVEERAHLDEALA